MTKKRLPPVRAKPRAGPKSGALTLAEAMLIAGVSPDDEDAPAPAARRPAPTAISRAISNPAPPTIRSIEAELTRYTKHRRELRKKRIRDYTATMKVLKARGVVAAPPAPQARDKKAKNDLAAAAPTPRVVQRPLQVLAEGDSWFDYPVPFFGGGIIKRLPGRIGVPVLELAEPGDEVRFMLGVEQRTELERHLRNGCPAGGPWDVLLFSGGGNDIVGDPMMLWVRDYEPAKPAAELLHRDRFQTALDLVRAGYEDLIALRDRVSPTTHLVFHTYDFAIPDGRGVCGKGPWLQPTFLARHFPATTIRFEVVKEMLLLFSSMLKTLARPGSVTVIDGQGLLPPSPDWWHNELHPSKHGFMAFADRFRDELRRLFPAQLP